MGYDGPAYDDEMYGLDWGDDDDAPAPRKRSMFDDNDRPKPRPMTEAERRHRDDMEIIRMLDPHGTGDW